MTGHSGWEARRKARTMRFKAVGTLVLDTLGDEAWGASGAKVSSYRCDSWVAAVLLASLFNAANGDLNT